ncbi:glyceraldehyde 3-phosphate phosphatase [Colletotrichum spaethianum]|uniref:Glyceraldehyde 3-phosphate phosphatase n=1 Tax=Colletotrichum spaethianum TaxID=700344 RepID=A0AA37L5J7_9PEZI|nr:glyceraldehyde 3-phosphate phosphatase [Colletotrichum spaethianum]GKT40364.1 glyceraldehyde 3-phosphate phosphatase [Colletotrichum spaethianum]
MSESKDDSLKAILAEKSWFGFDLDDTLHEFRRASTAATSKTLEVVSQRHQTPWVSLKEEYTKILHEKTAGAFSEGKTSFEYRRERFASLLERFSLPQDDAFLDELLEVYETTLNQSLQLKEGAAITLETLKGMGKKIAVITEGPQDAQERTVRNLGVADHIDFLATTNYFGLPKTEGLFPKVLSHLGITAADMVYVGDSELRDMEPAMAGGIFCIHLNEAAQASWASHPPRIKSLRNLEQVLA